MTESEQFLQRTRDQLCMKEPGKLTMAETALLAKLNTWHGRYFAAQLAYADVITTWAKQQLGER